MPCLLQKGVVKDGGRMAHLFADWLIGATDHLCWGQLGFSSNSSKCTLLWKMTLLTPFSTARVWVVDAAKREGKN